MVPLIIVITKLESGWQWVVLSGALLLNDPVSVNEDQMLQLNF